MNFLTPNATGTRFFFYQYTDNIMKVVCQKNVLLSRF